MEIPKICSTWSTSGSLAIFEPSLPANGNTKSREHATINHMRWHADQQTYASRKLINETHAIFMDLQQKTKNQEKSSNLNLVQTSRQYRSVIQSCLLEMQERIARETSADTIETTNSELSLFSIIEMIWHLCEIVLIDTQSGGYSLDQLLEWLKWHFTEVDISARQVISYDEPSSHTRYWETVYGFVFQGRINEAVNILSLHSHRDKQRYDEFASMEDLLVTMPRYQIYTGQPPEEFMLQWRRWQHDCRTRLSTSEFSVFPELEDLCQILSGDESTIEKHKDICQTWYQFTIAKLLYTNPVFKIYDIGLHCKLAIATFGGEEQLSSLDQILYSIVDIDVHQVIKNCSECLPNWWLVAHLSDLLYHAGRLKEHQLDYGIQLREFVLLEYSASLMAHNSLWIVAADYLLSCPNYGRDHLQAYIEHLPIETDTKALKVIHLCDKYGLAEQASTICKVMGMRAYQNGRLGASLSWSFRSKDVSFASYLAEKLLILYSETGTFSHLDLIENLGTTMLLSDKLTFLGKYQEFHSLYRNGKLDEAASLLVTLLTSNLVPKRFWQLLLFDAVPLMEKEQAIFDSAQTFELLHCVEKIEQSSRPKHGSTDNEESTSNDLGEEESTRLGLVRLSLSRNLARSLLNEAAGKECD